ncbi:NADH-quinone oxidoreductase subunit M [Flavitalea sp. BT771]|uniref:complex I subunit 4 family protein n=1 Tax=Flavitalea sp. BT771 TaxID=3063329 RepID=UPI0026E133C7|nr:NADH-quinone oxidoreductase subunit M [Flavitalea sp. BT771]MDO6429073.1 NADH-quinone oxidoreductase subunit M [Flavitalea sp. BT771]MDV6218799.1 NADH-quinone oxidoreductase subunit M [Flavitalea sp. BT771]
MTLLIGGLLSWMAARWNAVLSKWIALLAVGADLSLAGYWWFHFRDAASSGSSWFIDFQTGWIPSFGIGFHVAMDGLGLVLLLLTFFLGILAVLCSWQEIKERTGFFYFNLLWTLAGISGVFVAMDLFLFYFFWEVMLVPMFFLISIWGDARRRYAAYKFFIFTQAGGLLMLLAILALYFIHGRQTGTYTFDYFSLLHTSLASSVSRWILSGFLIAFAIKLPAVPFHSWLPDAHSEAPTAGSLLLAGLLLKTGAYGIIRFVLPLFPRESAAIAWWAILAGVIAIVYGALLAFAQTDLKRLIAYTSVSHMGFVLLGIFSFSEIAMQGAVMQILTHGISTGALFVMAGMLKERLHTRDIEQMGGLWTSMPVMGGAALLFTMASLGLPMLGNFIAEFLILLGTFSASVPLAVIASFGLVLSALYSLRMVRKVFLGPADLPLKDLSVRELLILAAMSIGIIALGLYPQPVIDMVRTTVRQLVTR